MKKITTFFLSILITLTALSPSICHTDNKEVLRICYFPLENNTTEYKEHPYHHYYYDYLQEISQHTGWVYEYVDASYTECLELLENQEIDIVCGIDQTDALTGILNRGAVQAQITMALEKEKQSDELVCPLISVDLDNFKAVNDTYGHGEGDLLLKAVARTLSHSVRQTDIVGRMGGDEFIVYLANVNSKKTAEKVAAKLCTAVCTLSVEKEEWRDISASFGVAFGNSNSNWETLYHQSDIALYDAKQKGKNQYSLYTDNMKNKTNS